MSNNKYNLHRNLAPHKPTHNQRRFEKQKIQLAAAFAAGAILTGTGVVAYNNYVESTKPLDAGCQYTMKAGETVFNDVAGKIAEGKGQPVDAAMYDLKRTGHNEDLGHVNPGQTVDVEAKSCQFVPDAMRLKS